MLPGNYTKDDVYKVLTELGSPSKLANEYNSQKRYLIGPAYFDSYISMLKLVISIVIAVVSSVTVLIWFIDSPSNWYETSNMIKLFEELLSSVISGGLQAALWVTVSFIVVERSGVESGNIPFIKKKWTPDDLPKTTSDENLKISRGESIFSIVMTILFTAIFYLRPQLLAIYYVGENDTMEMTSLFNINQLSIYANIIIVFALVHIVLFIWKYIRGRWSYPLAIFHSIYNFAVCLLVLAMFLDNNLISNEFVSTIAKFSKETSQTVSNWIHMTKWSFVFVLIAITIWDIISVFYKLNKYHIVHKV